MTAEDRLKRNAQRRTDRIQTTVHMDKIREDIKEKLISGRGNYIHPKY